MKHDVVLHVLSHVGEAYDRLNVELTELGAITNSRQHEYLWSVDCASGEYDPLRSVTVEEWAWWDHVKQE